MSVHPTAIVDDGCRLGEGVTIGPYCVLGADVQIGDRTTLGPHCCVEGPTTIGPDGRIGKHVCLGSPPQDRTYAGEPTRLEIGAQAILGDACNISRGTVKGGGLTRVGDRVMLMAHTHVGHDCIVEDDAVMVNYAGLSGHCLLERGAIVSGTVAVHQFARIGRLAMVQGGSAVGQDVPPYAWVGGCRARIQGLNRVGLQRAGFDREALKAVRAAFDALFRSGAPFSQALDELAASDPCPEVAHLLAFCRASTRGVMRWR